MSEETQKENAGTQQTQPQKSQEEETRPIFDLRQLWASRRQQPIPLTEAIILMDYLDRREERQWRRETMMNQPKEPPLKIDDLVRSMSDAVKMAIKEVLPNLDGIYALALTDNKTTVIARDKVGLRQLYYCTNNNHIAFASEKKPLMEISDNGQEIYRLLPGNIAILDGKKVSNFCFWSADSIKTKDRIIDKKEALEVYGKAISEVIQKSVAAKKRVGIIFSGGIDSLLLAYQVQKLGIPFSCYTVGREGAADIEVACDIARRLNFPLKTHTITLEEIEKNIPQIITTIEDHSLNQVEAAIALCFATQLAQEAGEQVILTGQGPDEICGGYAQYPKIVDQEGYESFEKYSWEDTLLSYKETFERENKIATAHGLEMIVPYVDPAMIEFAFQLSPELKIFRGNDQMGKRIHREFAVSIGIPEEIAFRKKEAAQHGANVHTALEELADSTGVTELMLDLVGYDPNQSVVEKLGSSSRYGFRYGEHHLWKPLPHVQYYLDSQAADVNLLPTEPKKHWEEITTRLKEKRPF